MRLRPVAPTRVRGCKVKQGTKEWFDARVGMVTASRVPALLGKSSLRSRADVIREMADELCGKMTKDTSAIKEHGIRLEPEAVKEFARLTGLTVREGGWHVHPEYPWAGASPDGLIGEDAGLEIKCPHSRSADDVLADEGYLIQVKWQQWVTRREKWYFSVYKPNEVPGLRTVQYTNSLKDLDSWADSIIPALIDARDEAYALADNRAGVGGFAELEARYSDLLEAHKSIGAELDKVKAEIIKLAEANGPIIGGLVAVERVSRKTIDSKAIIKATGVDPEPFTRESWSWRVRKVKPK